MSRDRKLPSGFSQRALTARSAVFRVLNLCDMNTNVILSKDSSPSDIERYFRGVLALDQQDKVFSVNLDDVW